MLTIINNYAHGYVTIPVILACKKHGLFETLSLTRPISFPDLVSKLSANSGHLLTALKILESLKWITRSDSDEYLLAAEASTHRDIPEDIVELLSFPINEYLQKKSKRLSLKKWIQMSKKGWYLDDPRFAQFLDGMFVIPLLLTLIEKKFIKIANKKTAILFSKLSPDAAGEILDFFANQGWILPEKDTPTLTEPGRFIMERIFITATVYSYKPLLLNISEIIFGDCKSIFERSQSGHEMHLDRTLNVRGSGFQHEKYFADMQEIILAIFNREPVNRQPKYIADMGCGDGSLLKRVYEIIKNKSLRGKILQDYPVKLIGIDYNEKALEETALTLSNFDHIVLKGDIGDPGQMILDLKNHGIDDTENILHIRSFLDHDRPYIQPDCSPGENYRSYLQSDAVFVDKEGKLVSPTSVIQNLKEHLARWSKVIGKYGLIVIEVHCLDTETIYKFTDKCESLHFDAYHRFSHQLLVSAQTFVMAAVESGLFPDQDFFRKYPKTLPFARITLTHFEQRDYKIRFMREDDLPELEALENKCWEVGLKASPAILKKRFQQYPEGQLVVEIDDHVAGVVYSQRIIDRDSFVDITFDKIEAFHNNEGSIIQLLAVNIMPDLQHRKLGDQLLEFMLQKCSLMNGVQTVVGITRCKEYHRHTNIPMQDYIKLRNKQDKLVDTTLRFHELHGAKIKKLVPGYWSKHINNRGDGVLIEYDVHNRKRTDIKITGKTNEKNNETIEQNKKIISDFVTSTIKRILGISKEQEFTLERPLMEMGLDSADLLELNEQISVKYQIQLEPSFFFKYSTPGRIVAFLHESLDLDDEEVEEKTEEINIESRSTDLLRDADAIKNDIAIIGISCRFPGGISNKEQLWRLLKNGKSAIQGMPAGRWNCFDSIDTEIEFKGIDQGGFLDEISSFDASFFRISPKEAELMDPQQRILLELCWECLENAGYPAKKLRGTKMGVFIGACGSDYNKIIERYREDVNAYYGLGTSMSVLPNRISYFFDLKGPSIQIDTACSSSLVAVHEAIKSIHSGECKSALVGGINIICHPSNSIAYYKAGMLAKDARCKTFDKAANGYVRGEGAVVIFLKPLEQAFTDQDSICAVIKGSAINHGGQASGLTVPNPEMQAALLIDAYTSAGIEPGKISYIEAHGTGTSLGDPVEISGLKEAFSLLSRNGNQEKNHYCGLGSIKTNIGHTEAAAGIAGLLKVVLSMQNKMIPASLNYNELNPHITLKNSPFYIVNKNQAWDLSADSPIRRAGVSSFGSGGTNAHVVLEEAPGIKKDSIKNLPAYLVCLSARTTKNLEQKKQDLAFWLENEGSNNNLYDICAALLAGRDHFAVRTAYIVTDLENLIHKLKNNEEFKTDNRVFEDSSLNKKSQNQSASEEFEQNLLNNLRINENDKKEEYINTLSLFAGFYIKGYDFDWDKIYKFNNSLSLNLPTYPFAGDKYWLDINKDRMEIDSVSGPYLHPLLQENIPGFKELCFRSVFTGKEFFLKDHRVKGRKVLPGVAYIEMARAAVAAALQTNGNRPLIIKNQVWESPIYIDKLPGKIYIGLAPVENSGIKYRIYSGNYDGIAVIHGQGTIEIVEEKKEIKIDIKNLQNQKWGRVLPARECYEMFKRAGFDYGPAHQAIESVYLRENEAFAVLKMPDSVLETKEEYVLHPSMMDAALQSALCLIPGIGEGDTVAPFAVDIVEIMNSCASSMYAVLRYSNKNKGFQFDIDLCDNAGIVCVRLTGLSMRAFLEDKKKGLLFVEPVWDKEEICEQNIGNEYTERLVFLCEPKGITDINVAKEIETQLRQTQCIILDILDKEKKIENRYLEYVRTITREIQYIFKSNHEGRVLVQIVVFSEGNGKIFGGLTGILKTAQLEKSKLASQLIELEGLYDIHEIISKLEENSYIESGSHISYKKGDRWIERLKEVSVSDLIPELHWQDGGVYLITGGTGKLGSIVAEDIANTTRDSILVLTGRSSFDEEKHDWLQKLEKMGQKAEYKQADVSRPDDISDLVSYIKKKYKRLNGIIHCAGVIKDNYIINKNLEEIEDVLNPKVKGTVNLDEATKEIDLDVFVLFSSIAGTIGNPGQVDYAAANAFMDAYAEYRNDEVSLKRRKGRTISINWPLWKDGGMNIDKASETMLLHRTGMATMEKESGIFALHRCIALKKSRVMVSVGDLNLMRQKLLEQGLPSTIEPAGNYRANSSASKMKDEGLREKIRKVLIKTVSDLLKVKTEDVDLDSDLRDYGFDSILFTEFTNKLNIQYNLDLNPTKFFEFPNLHGLSDYIAEEYRKVFDVKDEEAGVALAEAKDTEEITFSQLVGTRFINEESVPQVKIKKHKTTPIAIVGMSGIFPGARDIDEFWGNLLAEKDCITEIPGDRWDWRQYFGNPETEVNKTNVKYGGFIEGVFDFDPLFFGISPREAELMDPQQRLLMIYVWKAIEDAGYSPESLSGTKTGIFVGTKSSGYCEWLYQANSGIEGYTSTGLVPSVGPNRMSFFLDIHGPSEPIDTACSSSLVAIHRAVSAIENGGCRLAIAGGVNTIITPDLHISFNKAGMLSEDGKCKTFSDKANGYVRGEGVGMLFLKELASAEEAGDHIYGIIRSTAENHGGRANSLTSPNPNAQAELLVEAYSKAGIDPRSVSYIETHGTGTPLGDPIEINGLKLAFDKLYKETGDGKVKNIHCGLGSVKSNIGHLEYAAGIAGVIKVLLQIKHETLVKSLYSDTINPYIKLEDSPFYIVQHKKEWNRLVDEKGQELPRTAGISSFGFGGVNVHVVVEEYIPPTNRAGRVNSAEKDPVIIVLSATDMERLKESSKNLLSSIENNGYDDAAACDLAYTLQIGRKPMTERLGFTAFSMNEIKEKLHAFAYGEKGNSDLYYGQISGKNETINSLMADEDLQETIEKWFQKKKYNKILELWIKGLNFDWNRLHEGKKRNKISLPTYPFAKETYKIERKRLVSRENSAFAKYIHPLVHENISSVIEQKYRSIFKGDEFFLADHKLNGQMVLPGVAYLEMAREAVTLAFEIDNDGTRNICFKNVIWLKSLIVNEEPVTVNIGLEPGENGEINFDVYSIGRDGERTIHSQGTARVNNRGEDIKIDIQTLLQRNWDKEILPDEFYAAFTKMGIEYGPAHHGIDHIYTSKETVLAKLSMPSSVMGNSQQYLLHPSMMDSAFQTIVALISDSTGNSAVIPYAIDEVEVFGNCNRTMWVLTMIRNEVDGKKFNIDMYDDSGKLAIRMIGLHAKWLNDGFDTYKAVEEVLPVTANEYSVGSFILSPYWNTYHIINGKSFPSLTDRIVLMGGTDENLKEIKRYYPSVNKIEIHKGDSIDIITRKLSTIGEINHIIWLAPGSKINFMTDDALIDEQEEGVLQIFRIIKSMIGLGYRDKNIGWSVFTAQTLGVRNGDKVQPTHSSIQGLIGSLAKEYPNWRIRYVDVEDKRQWVNDDVFKIPEDSQGNPVAYRGGEWYRQKIAHVYYPSLNGSLYREGGVYVVIGGAGGVGEVWSEYLIRKYRAKLIWLGRRKKNAVIQAKLDRLGALGETPWYISADATNRTELDKTYNAIKEKYPEIHGVVHSAIALQDQSLAKMTEERFREGLSAKVNISVRIAQVFKNEPLDFVLFFSSFMSFAKTAGQSNYAAGCTFNDAFAKRLSTEFNCVVKVKNWGYWGNTGIVASKEYKKRMEKMGIGSIEPLEAMEALENLMNGPINQTILLKTINPQVINDIVDKEIIQINPESPFVDVQKIQQYVFNPV